MACWDCAWRCWVRRGYCCGSEARTRTRLRCWLRVLAVTSLAILGGTQVFFLRDFLQGGDWYRMNTLFKFFMQVWVLLGSGGRDRRATAVAGCLSTW